MNKRTRSQRLAAGTLIALACLAGAGASPADEPKNTATSKQLLSQDLAGLPGKEAIMLTVELPPGASSRAHRHDADVFVYVLEGSIVMQVDGQPEVTLGPGQTFHESPTDIHRKSANASTTQPVKFVVFIVKDKGKPVTRPVS